jgi:Glycosyl transferases group 1
MRKVAYVCQTDYFWPHIAKDLGEEFDTFVFRLFYDLTADDYRELIQFDADYNFFYRGEYVPEEVLRNLKGSKINLSSEPFPKLVDGNWDYTWDSVRRYLTFRVLRDKSFDFVYHYDRFSMPFFLKDGLNLSGEFVIPVDASQILRAQKYREHLKKKWDILFVGKSTPRREAYLAWLKHRYDFLHIAHGIWDFDLISYIDGSKIVLNVHAEPETSWEPRVQLCLACGAFVLTERISRNSYLREGTDYIEFSSPEDLFQKTSYYLENDNERQEIAHNGQKRVVNRFDARHAFRSLINDIESGNAPRFEVQGHGLVVLSALNRLDRLHAQILRSGSRALKLLRLR